MPISFRILAALIFFLCFNTISVYSEEILEKPIEEYKNISGIYVYKENSEPRSSFSSSIEKVFRDAKIFYKFYQKGNGDYDKYKTITWESAIEMEEKNKFLQVIYSRRTIKDKDGNIIIKHEKRFDYDKQKIYYTASDRNGAIIKKEIFPIKGLTVDNEGLISFMTTFAAHPNDKRYKSFYLISNEPRLYRINVKTMKPEVLELNAGKINAIKLRLIPDMGLLTSISNALIPPTFIWYTAQSPYTWLKYEGLETGLGSAHILAYITNR